MQTYSNRTNHQKSIIFVLVSLSFLMNTTVAKAIDLIKPPPPDITIPQISKNKNITTVICVDCKDHFGFPGHEQTNNNLLRNIYVNELRNAMYLQDTYHQFESKAHYDNCDFDSATNYIDELLQEIGKFASDAKSADTARDNVLAEQLGRKAFFSLGQALHAIQDFYAHSNYVELKTKNVKSLGEIPVIQPWTKDGKNQITDMQKEGLISGFVFWGVPQKCVEGTLSHKELAKDNNDTLSGKVKLQSLENRTQYEVALYLARKASTDFIVHVFKTYPILKKINGSNVAFDMLIERRGL